MFYPSLTDNLNRAVYALFAEPFDLVMANGSAPLEGIPDYRNQAEGVGRVNFNDRMLTLAITQAIFTDNQIASTAKSGQKINFRGTEYHIIEIQDDLGDLVELTLRRY